MITLALVLKVDYLEGHLSQCMITLSLVVKVDYLEGLLSMYDHSGSGLKG